MNRDVCRFWFLHTMNVHKYSCWFFDTQCSDLCYLLMHVSCVDKDLEGSYRKAEQSIFTNILSGGLITEEF